MSFSIGSFVQKIPIPFIYAVSGWIIAEVPVLIKIVPPAIDGYATTSVVAALSFILSGAYWVHKELSPYLTSSSSSSSSATASTSTSTPPSSSSSSSSSTTASASSASLPPLPAGFSLQAATAANQKVYENAAGTIVIHSGTEWLNMDGTVIPKPDLTGFTALN